MSARDEQLELQAMGDRFQTALHAAGSFVAGVRAQRDKAYSKLRTYKNQQSALVANQRLLKLEYKELKSKYDAVKRDLEAVQTANDRACEEINILQSALSHARSGFVVRS